MLGPRWTTLEPHAIQDAYKRCKKRFIITPAGRRSGKTEIAKRKLARRAHDYRGPSGRFICAAPTHDQAKEIYWDDMKALCRSFIERKSESERWIRLENGATIHVAGMDKPERAEGSPLDGIILDEFANMKPDVWAKHVRPALSTRGRLGWAIIPSVPEGRNHYFKIHEDAERQIVELGEASEWAIFWWPSRDILDPAEIEAARRELDPLTFAQEYEGSFVNFTGLAYYCFNRKVHAAERVLYNHRRPLLFCFDFNREPGVCVVAQMHDYRPFEPLHRPEVDRERPILAVIGEVHIPRGSKTPIVCRRLIKDWGVEGMKHEGDVYLYGDASGGNQGSAKVDGSDWDIIRAELRQVKEWRVHERIKAANPAERARVNAVNSALMSEVGVVSVLIDPINAPKTIEDFECTIVVEGGSGEIYKPKGGKAYPYTHLTDGFGYMVDWERPIVRRRIVQHAL